MKEVFHIYCYPISMSELIDEITKLTNEWYTLIGPDHLKDKDCHWYIETIWSYGHSPKYTIWHHGYILDKIEEECDSYDEALLKLKETLTYEIEQYIIYNRNDDDETGW